MGIYAPTPLKIAVFRPLQFGDLMCAVPALRRLRAAYPLAEITLIGLPWAAAFVDRFPHLVDRLIEFPGLPGFPERGPEVQRFPAFLAAAQAEEFDLALQMHGAVNLSNIITALLGARMTAGFYLPGNDCPNRSTYLGYPNHLSETHRLLALMDFLGFLPVQTPDDALEFPLLASDLAAFSSLQRQYALVPGEYVLINPGARTDELRWPAEKFAQTANQLAAAGRQVVITGTTVDRPVVDAILEDVDFPVVDLCGHTTFGSYGALLSHARLLITNDTGVQFLALALETPSLVLSFTSDGEIRGPNQGLHRRIAQANQAVPADVLAIASLLLAQEQTAHAISHQGESVSV